LRSILPSAHAPVVVDNLDIVNLSEAREDALQLVRIDLVVQVADIKGGVGCRIICPVSSAGPSLKLAGTLLGNSLQSLLSDGGRCVGGLGLRGFLGGSKVLLNWRLRRGLCEGLRRFFSGLFLRLHGLIASESPLERRGSPSLLA
jgi:hypothetical protein